MYSNLSKAKRRISGRVFCMMVVFTLLLGVVPLQTDAKTLDQIQQERAAHLETYNQQTQNASDLDAQMAFVQTNIDSLEEEQTLLQKTITELDGEIAACDAEISRIDAEIENLNNEIAAQEINLQQRETDIQNTYEIFMQRMVGVYMNGDVSTLTVLLNAEDFADFLYRSEMVKRLAQQDKEIVEQLKTEMAEIEAAKLKIQTAKSEQEALRGEQAVKRAEADGKRSEHIAAKEILDANAVQMEAEVINLQSLRDYALRAAESAKGGYDDATAAIEALQKELDNAQPADPVVTAGINFTWPVPGYYTISSPFGPRTLYGRYDYHTGIDIAGYSGGVSIYRATIVAAEEGYVTIAVNNGQWNSGWGNYVSIDHGVDSTDGNRYLTFYGHVNTVLVSVGQYVTKGTPIALVGSTGNSTGNHLHFEVRVNGQYVNPSLYVNPSK